MILIKKEQQLGRLTFWLRLPSASAVCWMGPSSFTALMQMKMSYHLIGVPVCSHSLKGWTPDVLSSVCVLMGIVSIWPPNFILCLLLLVRDCDAEFILVVNEPLGCNVLAPDLICLRSVWQKKKTTIVFCIECFTVLAVGLTMVIFCNHASIRAWFWYALTILFPATGSWIEWIMFILFWTSSIAFATARILFGYLQAGIVRISWHFLHAVVQSFLWLLCALSGRRSTCTGLYWFLRLHCSLINRDGSSSKAFGDSTSPWLSPSLRGEQLPNIYELLLLRFRTFFVLLITLPLVNSFWLHYHQPWLVSWTLWIFILILCCMIATIASRQLLWRRRHWNPSTENLYLLSRKLAAFLTNFTKWSLVHVFKADAFALPIRSWSLSKCFCFVTTSTASPLDHAGTRFATGFSITSWRV